MNLKQKVTVSLLLAVACGTCAVAWSQNKNNQEQRKPAIDKQTDPVVELKRKITASPSNPSPDTVRLIERVGSTKKLGAALILIQAFAFNFDSMQSDETLSQTESIPAIVTLKRYYGKESLPLLYTVGIQTDEGWMRERCALAIQYIASPSEQQVFSQTFSLETTQNSQAKSLESLIKSKPLKVFMYSPLQEPIIIGPKGK